MNRMPFILVREFRNTLMNKGTAFRKTQGKLYIFLPLFDRSISLLYSQNLKLIRSLTRVWYFSFVMFVSSWIFGGGKK